MFLPRYLFFISFLDLVPKCRIFFVLHIVSAFLSRGDHVRFLFLLG